MIEAQGLYLVGSLIILAQAIVLLDDSAADMPNVFFERDKPANAPPPSHKHKDDSRRSFPGQPIKGIRYRHVRGSRGSSVLKERSRGDCRVVA